MSTTASRPIDYAALLTLGDITRQHGRTRPEAIAASFEGRETSYAALDRHANRVANALLAAGLRKGDRISYLGKNSDHYFEIMLGAAKMGAVLAPIAWRLAAAEVRFILSDTGARLLFLGPECADIAREALGGLPDAPKVIALEADFAGWRDAAGDGEPDVSIDPSDVAVQMYTSGTTGHPKGAMLTHANLLAGRRDAIAADMAWNRWQSDDVSLVAMPVAHVGGTIWGMIGLFNGAKNLIVREFDPLRVLDFIEHDRVSQIFIVPSALQIVVNQARGRDIDFSRLRCMQYGASPIPLDLLRESIALFGCGFCQQYGMTETSGTIAYLPPEDHDPAGSPRMRSAGKPMPGVAVRILGPDGAVLPPNAVGEVAIKSVQNMAGYWQLPEATASTITADGWLRTGDAGHLDEDGYIHINDRVKDMIISGAENIYPAEVENAIYGHPHVAEVAVIGVPDEKWGEAVKAVIVPRPGIAPDANDILAFTRTRIAGFKVPKSIDFIDALPRNPTGKVLKRVLREPYWSGRERQVN